MTPAEIEEWFEEIDEVVLNVLETDRGGSEFYSNDALEWVAEAESALQQVFPNGHPIRQQWADRLAGTQGQGWMVQGITVIDALRAIFRSATKQLKRGRLKTLVGAVRAEDAAELLDQAAQLASANHLAAAAVIAGGALETMLRHLCEQADALPQGNGSISKYEKALAELRKSTEVISKGDGKQVTAWADIRNEAAHNPGGFSRSQAEVRLMIEGIRGFVSKQS